MSHIADLDKGIGTQVYFLGQSCNEDTLEIERGLLMKLLKHIGEKGLLQNT